MGRQAAAEQWVGQPPLLQRGRCLRRLVGLPAAKEGATPLTRLKALRAEQPQLAVSWSTVPVACPSLVARAYCLPAPLACLLAHLPTYLPAPARAPQPPAGRWQCWVLPAASASR